MSFSEDRRATMDAPHARTPDATATQGPSHGRENAGGKTTERADATATAAPRIASAMSRRRPGSGRPRETNDRTRPATAAAAAKSDQRPARVQAPNAPDPGPNRLQGSVVATIAAPKAMAVIVLIARSGPAVAGSIEAGASAPSTFCRHSEP